MARRKKSNGGGVSGDGWLATYSDTITLLLTFFVLLYSMSSVDAQKLKQISNAFNEIMTGKSADSILQFDLYDGKVPLVGGESSYEEMIDMNGTTDSSYEEIKSFVDSNDLNSVVEITEDERGIIIQLRDSILFESGKANLKPDSMVVLDKISELIGSMANSIIIEGHTDNVPHNSAEYESNWELSSARAVMVLRYFVDGKGQNPTRFSAAGYGEYKPLVSNITDEDRAKNRRVNILIVASKEE